MSNKIFTLIILFAFAAVLLFISKRQKKTELEKRRRENLKRDYPELVSKLLLLLQAGLVCRSAFKRIASDYEKDLKKGKKVREAYEEVTRTCAEMEKGVGEIEAYRNFGQRCSIPSYRTLSVLIAQNVKKGGTGLLEMLEREMVTAMEERKRTARADGEKASVKLLLPMGMMLVVVMTITIVPAFMSM